MAQEFESIKTMLEVLKPDAPIYALHPQTLRQAAQNLIDHFPGDVIYAVQANPHIDFLRALYAGGVRHFDAANLENIKWVKENFPAAHIYFMHPVKSGTAIREAAHLYGVNHFAVDHPDELAKVIIHTLPKKPTIVIRLALPLKGTSPKTHEVFGCTAPIAITLARAAAAEGLGVGLGFHIDEHKTDPYAYRNALDVVNEIIHATGIHPELINTGGGFPVAGPAVSDLQKHIDVVSDHLLPIRRHYPTRLICEPSRSLAALGASLIIRVELRRHNELHLNDGIYGGLGELRHTPSEIEMRVWRVNGHAHRVTGGQDLFHFYGPTCDNADVVMRPFQLPADIRQGDYIEISHMGSHSMSQRTAFNGSLEAQFVIINECSSSP